MLLEEPSGNPREDCAPEAPSVSIRIRRYSWKVMGGQRLFDGLITIISSISGNNIF